MAHFAPPSHPPPPELPDGWKADWSTEYKRYFFVNEATGESQWEKPTGATQPPSDPPAYDHGSAPRMGAEKSGSGSNNPGGPNPSLDDDERLARQLQEEYNAESKGNNSGSGSRGAADSYYQGGSNSSPYGQQSAPSPQPAQSTNKGLFSKLSSRLGGSSPRPPQQQYGQQGYSQQQYGQQYPPQGGYGGGGYYPPQQQGGYYPQQQGGYYPQQQQVQQPQRRTGGLGAGGGALLGAGAGLLGGALLMDAFDDHSDQMAYQDGFQDGGGGDDYGNDDFGGGDF